MLFWKLPNDKYLAFIPRTGSTAWGQAILDAFYPIEKIKQQRAATPDNSLAIPQFFIPSDRDPKTGTLLGVIRDPIERFRSGFSRAANGRSVDQLIADLLANKDKPVNAHIRRVTDQFDKHIENIRWFKYETDLVALAMEIGIEVPSTANESEESDKPTLTDEQLSNLNTYYADDIVLHQRNAP